ncbi:MAG TPA: biopolymer transporter ExbD [Phycisphaerae bacterium]|nr:biopolymer transporter ExbD [Phycisphaerae bacterium]HPM23252.1 biopolymer transporter ExbD [Phycisphaerae bacterium]
MLIRSAEANGGPALDMMPMIDMVFNLLIFFLVATTFHQVEREMQIALPIAQAGGPVSAVLRELVINVDQEGTIFVAGRRTSAEDLHTVVKDAVAANREQKVTVRGDRHAAYGRVVAVLDICKQAGIQEPYLDTVLE